MVWRNVRHRARYLDDQRLAVASVGSASQRVHEAIAAWEADPAAGPEVVVDAACIAIIEGLESPALQRLASPPAGVALRTLVDDVLADLQVALPAPTPKTVSVSGSATRPALDSLRFDVVPADVGGGFQVQVFVNGMEITSRGAGLGLDPYDLVIPENRLVATSERRTVPLARCKCGVYGCRATDVTIVRDLASVHWDFSEVIPLDRGVTFPADQYDAQVGALGSAFGWETAERKLGRLVWETVDHERLADNGLRLRWVAGDQPGDGRDSLSVRIALDLGRDYQVMLTFDWRGRSPVELARLVRRTLARPPQGWRATWQVLGPLSAPPHIAGPAWRPAGEAAVAA